jgi:hypothetical protein
MENRIDMLKSPLRPAWWFAAFIVVAAVGVAILVGSLLSRLW